MPDEQFYAALLPIERRIANELIGGTPENWGQIVLVVVVEWKRNFLSLDFDITSPEGHSAETVSYSEELKGAVEDLVHLHKTHGIALTRYEQTAVSEDEGWRFKSRYA